MTLFASLTKLEKNASRAYLKLSQHFSGNTLIRDTWATMSQDMEQQAASLRALRLLLKKELKSQEKTAIAAIKETTAVVNLAVPRAAGDWSLHHCFTRSLDFEEPLTLKVIPPLIYQLRKEWTDQALDFYILVNAHLTRLARLIGSTSGDPVLIKRCSDLVLQFERATQVPQSEPSVTPKRADRRVARSARVAHPVVKRARKARLLARAPKPSRTLAKGAGALTKRAKPLLKNIKLARRRARR